MHAQSQSLSARLANDFGYVAANLIDLTQPGARGLLRRLVIVEPLAMGKGLRGIEDVNHSRHVCMQQAHQLEVAWSEEHDGVGRPTYQDSGVDACSVRRRRAGWCDQSPSAG